jgi:hypothetical protein
MRSGVWLVPGFVALMVSGCGGGGGGGDNATTDNSNLTATASCPSYQVGDTLTYAKTINPTGLPAMTSSITRTVTSTDNDQVVMEGGGLRTVYSTAGGRIVPLSDEDTNLGIRHEFTSTTPRCPAPEVGESYDFTTYEGGVVTSRSVREVTGVEASSVSVPAGNFDTTLISIAATEIPSDGSAPISGSIQHHYSDVVGAVKSLYDLRGEGAFTSTMVLTSYSIAAVGEGGTVTGDCAIPATFQGNYSDVLVAWTDPLALAYYDVTVAENSVQFSYLSGNEGADFPPAGDYSLDCSLSSPASYKYVLTNSDGSQIWTYSSDGGATLFALYYRKDGVETMFPMPGKDTATTQ